MGVSFVVVPTRNWKRRNFDKLYTEEVRRRNWRTRIIKMEIKHNGSQPSTKGSSDYFSGDVRLDPLFEAHDPARTVGSSVTFEPGARTAWHTHPLGQILIVTSGCGLAQKWGGPVEKILPGDVVWFPPGEKHWHGAAPSSAMTHIAIQEQVDGKRVDWMEQLSDEHYSDSADRAFGNGQA
jgi:quercetin dioxygenase-like cupin family protein